MARDHHLGTPTHERSVTKSAIIQEHIMTTHIVSINVLHVVHCKLQQQFFFLGSHLPTVRQGHPTQ